MKEKMLSIVIPCYNEGDKIRKNLWKAVGYLDEMVKDSKVKDIVDSYELLVIDDGSKDNTAEEMKSVNAPTIQHVYGDVNHGKGYCVRLGFEKAQGEYIMFMDADLAIDLSGIDKALLMAAANPHTAVIGSRKNPMSFIEEPPKWYREILSWGVNLLSRHLLPLRDMYDTQCGFKLYPHRYAKFIAEKQLMERFSFDLEHLIIVRINGGEVKDIPVHYYKQTTTTVRPVRDSIRFFKDLMTIRNNHLGGAYKKNYERKHIECEK